MKGLLSKFAFWKRAKTQKWKGELNLKAIKRKNWFLAYSPEARSFIAKNKKVLRSIYEFVHNEDNIKRLKNSAIGIDVGGGIHIGYDATGLLYRGEPSVTSTLKVSVAGKVFFVKINKTNMEKAADVLHSTQVMEKYLRKRHYKVGEFNVRVIKPMLLYEPTGGKTYVATEFYKEGDVILIYDMEYHNFADYRGIKGGLKYGRDLRFSELRKTIQAIRMDDENKAGDVFTHNAFYQPKTNTILLFDLRRH
ncbi:MAG: hypothetical protein HYW05_03775 [Candidatus Diapherotrites archaeon]|nr:hypothetical protein [Candidatus Diapherotrites archaeon]